MKIFSDQKNVKVLKYATKAYYNIDMKMCCCSNTFQCFISASLKTYSSVEKVKGANLSHFNITLTKAAFHTGLIS